MRLWWKLLKQAASSASPFDTIIDVSQFISVSRFQPFAAETARVMLKNLSASLCSPARLAAAASFAPLVKALSPDHKVAFWEEVKKRLDERLAKEGESEVLDVFHFFLGNYNTESAHQVLSEMLKTYGSCISAFAQNAFPNPAADIPRVIQLCFKCVQDSAKNIVDVSCLWIHVLH